MKIAATIAALGLMATSAQAVLVKQTLSPYLCESVANGGVSGWANPTNAQTSNNSRAVTGRLTLSQTTDVLLCYYAAPTVPLSASFRGLNVRVEGQQGYGYIADAYVGVAIVNGGVWPSFANPLFWHNGPVDTSMGHPSDDAFSYLTWGVPWCVDAANIDNCLDEVGNGYFNINATRGFAVYFAAQQLPGGGAAIARVDTITVDVIYED